MESKVLFGEILKPQGVDGEVKAVSDFQESDGIGTIRELYCELHGKESCLHVRSIRDRDGFLYIMFDEITDRDKAETLRGAKLRVFRGDLKLDPNTNFREDIIGCALIADEDQSIIGTVVGIRRLPVHDVYEIKTPSGTGMIPALLRIFPEIDVERKTIRTVKKYFLECFVEQ